MRILIVLLLLWNFVGCRQLTEKEQIKKTAEQILLVIDKGDVSDFRNFIGLDLADILKTESGLVWDFNNIKKYKKIFLGNKKPELHFMKQTNGTSLCVEVPIYHGRPGIDKVTFVMLKLYFGPPGYVPLTRISGYDVEIRSANVLLDLPRRTNLLSHPGQ